MTNTTNRADIERTAVAITRAMADADEAALRTLLDPMPTESLMPLLAAMTALVIVAQASPRMPLTAFLDGRLADVNSAEVIASQLGED